MLLESLTIPLSFNPPSLTSSPLFDPSHPYCIDSSHPVTNLHIFCHTVVYNLYVCLSCHSQCCQRRGLPAQLGYFEILCRGSKNCWAGGLKLGNFSFVCPRQLFFFKFASFLSIQRIVEPLQCPRTFFSSISGLKTS